MSLTASLNTLDWWGCVLAAFLPGLLVAAIGLPIGRRINVDNDDAEARNRLIALVSAAFAFIVAFTTNTLWTQDLAIAESARAVGQSSSEIMQASEQVGPDFADQTRELLERFDKASETNDIDAGLSEGSTGVKAILDQMSQHLTASASSTKETGDSYQAFHEDYMQYLSDLNAPSVPALIVLVVVLLGIVMAGVIAASPRNRHRMSTRVFLALSVFVIGLYQFPMWVLNSRKLVLEAIHPYLSPVDQASKSAGTGVNSVILLLIAVIAVLFVIIILPGFLGGGSKRTPAEASENQPTASDHGAEPER